jgi:cell fate regulator YaaT (PSP1 superfamily)
MKVLVRFEGSPVNYSLEHNDDINLNKGQILLVETSRGLELVKVLSKSSKISEKKEEKSETFEEAIDSMEEEKLSFVRVASPKEIAINEENKQFADTIKKETRKLVQKYELEMKISGIRVTLDKNKVVIYFTAENRVDFRELVKELASLFKTRIELRQVGSRDEARLMGGIGPCGQPCCCKRFLNDFGHVSIKMAKTQNLSLNPTKISGLCGRLMCCLDYENQHYAETAKIMPRINSLVSTPSGNGIVLYNDLLKQNVQVKIADDNNNYEVKTFKMSEIKTIKEN